MRCIHCGQEHPDNASFCPVTGKIISVSTPRPKNKQVTLVFATLIILGLVIILAGVGWVVKGFLVSGNIQDTPPLSSGKVEETAEEAISVVHEGFSEDGFTSTVVSTSLAEANPSNTAIPTRTTAPSYTPKPSATSMPTDTPKPTATPEPTHTLTPTETQPQFEVRVNEIDQAELIRIPAGEFIMGVNAEDDPLFWGAEGPAHLVTVDEYWIYRTEVTNGMYQRCVADKQCPRPGKSESSIATEYYGNAKYEDYPVVYVSYVHAASYCIWAGGKLPTEAQWEKAARGEDGRLYPWGNQTNTNERANLCGSECTRGGEQQSGHSDSYPGPAPVGSFPNGASPYGLLDMAGNVWEWVFDYFNPQYYDSSVYDNPLGPASGTRRGIRGGGWNNPHSGVRTVARTSLGPDLTMDTVGFRCVILSP